MLSFLQEIGKEPAVIDYLKTGKDLALLRRPEGRRISLYLHGDSVEVALIQSSSLGDSVYKIITPDSLEKWIETKESILGPNLKRLVGSLAASTEKKIWDNIREDISSV